MQKAQVQLSVERFSFSIRLDSLFFPVTMEELRLGLEKLDYSLNADVERALAPASRPAGARVSIGGTIANKTDPPLQFRTDMERGILGIDGRGVGEVVDDFTALEDWIREELCLDLSQEARFYELILEGSLAVGQGRDPIDTLKHLYAGSPHLSSFAKVVGRDVTNFGVRLVEKGQVPSANTWLDIRVEPSIQRGNTAYTVNVVFRDPDRAKVVAEANRISDTVAELVVAMEQESHSAGNR